MRPIPLAAVAALLALAACVRPPQAPPLSGAVAPRRLPATELPPVHRKLVFTWEYTENGAGYRGEGAARVAPPDSVRLDLFAPNGMGSTHSWLLGDTLIAPQAGRVKNILPPVSLLWASLGRLRVAAVPDTAARVDGDTLRVDIGTDPRWRATFVDDDLRRLDRITGGRIREWVRRDPGGRVVYENEGTRRRLLLTVTRVDTVPGFDETIWP